jgi:hypothetical protein
MRILPASLLLFLTIGLLSLAVTASKPASTAAAAAGAAEAAPAAKPTAPLAAKPQAIVGVVCDSAGKPIKSGVVVTVAGRTTLGGARADYTVTPDENGRYESDLPDGVYKVWATVDVDYNGRHFRLPLASEDKKDMHAAYNSAKGIVKNFTWQLSGLLPGARPREYGSYWGVGVLLFDAGPTFEPDKHLKGKYPGSSVVVHLEPVGPLVDGSKGKALDLETPSDALDIRNPKCKHLDVPLGDYKATATLKLKDGSRRPLMIEVGPRVEVSKPGIKASREVTLEYEQNENGSIPSFNLSLGE